MSWVRNGSDSISIRINDPDAAIGILGQFSGSAHQPTFLRTSTIVIGGKHDFDLADRPTYLCSGTANNGRDPTVMGGRGAGARWRYLGSRARRARQARVT